MSQSLDPSPVRPELRQEFARKKTDIDSHATFLTFEPGLYSIDFQAATASMSDVGLPLPCARLEPVTNPASPGRGFVSMTPEGGWLSRGTAAAHILVVGGRAGAVLTMYRSSDGMPLPEVRFRSVLERPAEAAAPAMTAQAVAGAMTAPSDSVALPADGPTLLVHVEGVGDRRQVSGDWVGDTSGTRSIEGFALSLAPGMAPSDLEYQGIMGEDWRTPWFEAGAFCGSRGLQLPLLGFRMRLVGPAAERFECRAWGQFARLGVVGPVASGEDCHADNMPLTAMKVELVPKAVPEPPSPLVEDPVKKSRFRRPKV